MPNWQILRFSTRSVPRRRHRAATAILSAALVSLCACAGTGTSGGATVTSGAPTTECGKAARTAYEGAMPMPEFKFNEAIDTTTLSGKKFAYVGIFTNSVVQAKYNAFREAMESIGAATIYFDGKGRPDAISQGFSSAIAQGVAGIVTDGYNAAALAGSAVVEAHAAGIPVINNTASDPSSPLPDGVAANVGPGAKKTGTIQADYAMGNTDCNLHALVLYATASQLNVDVADGFNAELTRLCPTDCTVTRLEVHPGSYATELAPQLQTALQRAPTVNFIALAGGDVWAPYAVQGVKSLGRHVPVIGAEGSGLADAIKGNGVLVADVLWTPAELLGYFAADAAMRAAIGHPTSLEVPIRLVDSTNWGTNGDVSSKFQNNDSVKQHFRSLWGSKK
jgi:hypothetical protein